jgi:fucose permease
MAPLRGNDSRSSGVPAAVRQARIAVSLCLLTMGLTNGVWVARIPAVKAQAHLSDGVLGVALFAVPVGLLLGAALAERLVDRVGGARVARVSGVVLSLAIITPGLAHDVAGLMAALLVVGVSGGTLDVAQNAQGVRVENAYRRPVMASLHACYSLGAIVGSLAGGGFAWAGVGPLPSLAVAGIIGAVVIGVVGHWLLAGPEKTQMSEIRHGKPDNGKRDARARRSRRRTWRLVIALGVLGVCALVGEGAAGDWSAVYLRDNLGASAGFAALGFAAFSVTMTAGRLVGDRLVRRFGPARLIRGCGLVAAVGLAGGLLSDSPVGAVIGLAVFGAGLSSVIPQVFAAGGRADPERPGAGLARVVGFGYAGMTAGPAVIGAVASQVGLPLALGIPVMLTLWIAVAAPVLGSLDGQRGTQGAEPPTVRENERPRAAAGTTASYGRHMDDKEIQSRISELIRTEHELRDQLTAGKLSSEQERERLRSAEEALDQCWDLLRQRRARREFGENPDAAAARPTAEVEGYQQ